MLDKQTSKVTVKDDEKALYAGRRSFSRNNAAMKHGLEDNKSQ